MLCHAGPCCVAAGLEYVDCTIEMTPIVYIPLCIMTSDLDIIYFK